MSNPINWQPGMRARCINPGRNPELRQGALYFVTRVHVSPGCMACDPPLIYLALAPSVSPEWNSTRFVPVVPACDRKRRGPSTLEAHDDFWKDAD